MSSERTRVVRRRVSDNATTLLTRADASGSPKSQRTQRTYQLRYRHSDGKQAGRHYCAAGEWVTFGRAETCTVQLLEASVSHRHARVRCEDGYAEVEDLGSKNGVFVEGSRIDGSARMSLPATISLGPYTVTLESTSKTSRRRNRRPIFIVVGVSVFVGVMCFLVSYMPPSTDVTRRRDAGSSALGPEDRSTAATEQPEIAGRLATGTTVQPTSRGNTAARSSNPASLKARIDRDHRVSPRMRQEFTTETRTHQPQRTPAPRQVVPAPCTSCAADPSSPVLPPPLNARDLPAVYERARLLKAARTRFTNLDQIRARQRRLARVLDTLLLDLYHAGQKDRIHAILDKFAAEGIQLRAQSMTRQRLREDAQTLYAKARSLDRVSPVQARKYYRQARALLRPDDDLYGVISRRLDGSP